MQQELLPTQTIVHKFDEDEYKSDSDSDEGEHECRDNCGFCNDFEEDYYGDLSYDD